MGPFDDRRPDGKLNLVEHHGLQCVRRDGAHERHLLTSGRRGRPAGSLRDAGLFVPDRPRPEIQRHDQRAVRPQQGAGAWAALSWRYDSGLVASAIGDVIDLLTLTPAQQAAAGVSAATVSRPRRAPDSPTATARGASRLVVPAAGTGGPLNNPSRVAPRNLFDLGFGADNLLRTDKNKLRLHVSVVNLTNKEALYNFLSTFSGTHFVTPRTYQVQVGWTF